MVPEPAKKSRIERLLFSIVLIRYLIRPIGLGLEKGDKPSNISVISMLPN